MQCPRSGPHLHPIVDAMFLPSPIFNLRHLVTALFIIYYIALSSSLGICFGPFLTAGYLIARDATSNVCSRTSIPISAALHVLLWAMKISFHLVFEGRRPDIVDSLNQICPGRPGHDLV